MFKKIAVEENAISSRPDGLFSDSSSHSDQAQSREPKRRIKSHSSTGKKRDRKEGRKLGGLNFEEDAGART